MPTAVDTMSPAVRTHDSEVHGGGGLELVKPAREPASSRPKSCASLK